MRAIPARKHVFFLHNKIHIFYCQTLYFFGSMYLFWCVLNEFERKNDFQQPVLKIGKNKEKSVSENVFFNEKYYLKIRLLKSDLTYTIKNVVWHPKLQN